MFFKKTIVSSIIATALAIMTFSGTSGIAQADSFNVKLATGHPPGFHYVKFFKEYFAPELIKRVAARTEHTMSVTELYSASAVKVTETLEGVQRGVVDIGGGCYCFEAAKLPLHAFQVWTPFGPFSPIKSLSVARDVYSTTPELIDIFEKKFNQKLIGLIVLDPYEIISRKPLMKLTDLKGYKIGAAGANLAWLEGTGAVPVQTNGAIAYTSLQTGVFDAVIGFASFFEAAKFYEIAPHYMKIGVGSVTWLFVHINLDTYNKFPPEIQKIIDELGRDYEQVIAMDKEEAYLPTLQRIADKGGTIHELSDETKAKWAESLKGLPAKKAKEFNAKGYPASAVLKRSIASAEKHGHEWPIKYKVD